MSNVLNPCLNCGNHPKVKEGRIGCVCDTVVFIGSGAEDAWNRVNPASVLGMVRDKLHEIGADGLCHIDPFTSRPDCGCGINNLEPCGGLHSKECTPGFAAHGFIDGAYWQTCYYPTRQQAEAAKAKTREQLESEARDE